MIAPNLRAADFLAALQSLLPRGPAWPRRDSTQAAVMAAFAARLEMMQARILVLSEREADPSQTAELLPDWERAFGLPDPCGPNIAADGTPLVTLAQRQARLVQRITGRMGCRPADYVALAASLGVTTTVTEFFEHDCEQSCETPVYGPDWRHTWQLNAPATSVVDSTCEDGCETPLRVWGNGPLECFVRRAAPAHTIVLFAYS